MGARRGLRLRSAATRLVRALGGPFWFRVRGRSMLPTLRAGDAVFIRPRPADRIPPGSLVVADDPDGSGRVLVKRLGLRAPGGFVVHADNRSEGRDSRHFGPLPPDRIRGPVVLIWTTDGALRRPVSGTPP